MWNVTRVGVRGETVELENGTLFCLYEEFGAYVLRAYGPSCQTAILHRRFASEAARAAVIAALVSAENAGSMTHQQRKSLYRTTAEAAQNETGCHAA